MKFRKTFQWDDGSDNDFGESGWSPALGDESIFPGSGLTVAHDTIEHGIGSDSGHVGSDELRALGALTFVRIQSGWTDEGGRLLNFADLASDLVLVAQNLHLGNENCKGIGCPIDDWAESIFQEAKETFVQILPNEFDKEQIANNREGFRWLMKNCIPLMRAGYTLASDAFDGYCHHALDLFQEIQKTVDKRFSDSGDYFHGQRLTLDVDTDKLSVTFFLEE